MDSAQDARVPFGVSPEQAAAASDGRTLARRALTALWGVPLVVGLVLLGGPWLLAGVVVLIVVGLLEFYRMAARAGYQPIWEAGVAAGVWLAVAAAGSEQMINVPWPPAVSTSLLLPALLLYTILMQLRRGHPDRGLMNTGITLLGVLYVAYLATYVIHLRALPLAPGRPASPVPALLVICAVWASDSAAYFVGLSVGRHKLLPRVSPHKSREGAAAGITAGVLVGAVFAWTAGLPVPLAAVVGGLCAAAGIVGDLWESSIKREVGVKDAGWVLPGHGGMLDRFDGLLFAVVTGYAVMGWWLGL